MQKVNHKSSLCYRSLFLAAAAVISAMPARSQALTTYYWSGQTNGDWFGANNWKTAVSGGSNFTMPTFGDTTYVLSFSANGASNVTSNFLNAYLECNKVQTEATGGLFNTTVGDILNFESSGGFLQQGSGLFNFNSGGANAQLSGRQGTLNMNIVNADAATNVTVPIKNYTLTNSITSLVKSGLGVLNLNTVNTYTGTTTVNGGILAFTNSGTIPVSSTITVNNGGTLRFDRNDTWGNNTTTSTSSIVINSGGQVVNSAGRYNALMDVTFGGGTMIANGGFAPDFPSYAFKNSVTVNGTGTSLISAGGLGLVANRGIAIGPSSAAGTLTVNVTDPAGRLQVDVPLISIKNDANTLALANGLIKSGPGTLTLTDANTYTGGTTINSGTLSFSGSGTTPVSSTITVNNGGTLRFDRNDTWGNATTTSTSSIVINSGGQVVNAAGIYNALMNVTFAGGTLVANGGYAPDYPSYAFKNSVTVNGTGTSLISAGGLGLVANRAIAIGPTSTQGSLSVNVTNSTGNLQVDIPLIDNKSDDNSLIRSNGLIKSGPGTLSLTAANTYTGGTTISGGILSFSGSGTSAVNSAITVNNGGTLRFDRNDTWGIHLTTSSSSIVINSGGQVVNSAGFYNSLIDVTFNGGTMVANGGAGPLVPSYAIKNSITVNGSGTSQISAGSLGLVANRGIAIGPTNADGVLNVNVTNAAGALQVDVPLIGNIHNDNSDVRPNGLTKTGPGKLTLNAANTYTGVTTISSGVLQIGIGATTGSLSTSGSITNNGSLVFNRSNNISQGTDFSGSPISGSGSVTKSGAGTLTLTAVNTYIGGTTVSAGTLQIDPGAATSSTGPVAINSGGTLLLARTDTWGGHDTNTTPAITINPGGTLENTEGNFNALINLTLNNGTLKANSGYDSTYRSFGLKGTVTVNGATTSTISAGTGAAGALGVNIGNNSIDGVTTFHVSDSFGILDVNAPLVDYANFGVPVSSGVVKTGQGFLRLLVASTYTGSTTINGGGILADVTNALPTSTHLTINSGFLNVIETQTIASLSGPGGGIGNYSVLTISQSIDTTFGGVIYGNGSMVKSGAGTLTLTAANVNTGNTTVSGGKLVTTQGIKSGAAVSIGGGATLEIPAGGDAAKVTSIGALNITGAGSHLDVHDNDLVSDYGAGPSTYADIVNHVKSGLTLLGGAGTDGITSTEVDNQTISGTVLAVVDDGDPNIGGGITSLSGFTIPNPATSVLVKFTWFGDANLDGIVDGSDYALTDTGFTSSGTLNGWLFGDYDYSGFIDGGDYGLQDTGFIAQTGALPEPATLGLLGMSAMGLMRRRRAKCLFC